MVYAAAWTVILHIFPKGNSHDLQLKKWYISATLLLCKIVRKAQRTKKVAPDTI